MPRGAFLLPWFFPGKLIPSQPLADDLLCGQVETGPLTNKTQIKGEGDGGWLQGLRRA